MSAAPTPRTEVRRLPERGSYDRDLIDSILDEALICHVGFVHEGSPVVIPTIHARVGDTLYFHFPRFSGEPVVAGDAIRGRDLCQRDSGRRIGRRPSCIPQLDELPLGGGVWPPRIVHAAAEKWAALEAVTEHVVHGSWADSRPMTDREFRGTLMAALPISEASAKVRTGGAKDDAVDYELPIWAGVVPLAMTPGEPIEDVGSRVDVAVPAYVAGYQRPQR
jgi:hypothetical protein